MLEIYADGNLIDAEAVQSFNEKWVIFNDLFKLGSIISREITMTLNAEHFNSNYTTYVIKHNDELYATMNLDNYSYVEGGIPKVKITLLDGLTYTNTKYDASNIVPCSLSDILDDILMQHNLVRGNDGQVIPEIEVNFWDNTISAREYLSMIAEMCGGFGRIEQDGLFYIRNFDNITEYEVDPELCEKLNFGEENKVERVIFDNNIIKYETSPDESLQTLYLNTNNVYILNEELFTNIANKILNFTFYDIELGKTPILDGMITGDVFKLLYDDKTYYSICSISNRDYFGLFTGTYDLKLKGLQNEQKNIGHKMSDSFKTIQTKVDRNNNTINTIITEQDEQKTELNDLKINQSGINLTLQTHIENLQDQIFGLELDANQLLMTFKRQNGSNLIRNSVMRNGTAFWYKEIYDMYTKEKPENPALNQLWFNENDENYKRNQMYQWDGSEWLESPITKKDIINTGVDGFTFAEDKEARENSISNSIVTMTAGQLGEKSHIFGITEEMPITLDTEHIAVGMKVKNLIETGNIYMIVAFAPFEISRVGDQPEALHSIYEEWYKITPDDFTNGYQRLERYVKVPKEGDLRQGYIGATAPQDTTLMWLDTTTGTYPKAKVYNNGWELCDNCTTLSVDGDIYTYREFYSGYYKTIFKKDEYVANYMAIAFSHYPGFNFSFGPELPESGERDTYFGVFGTGDQMQDIVYRAKFRDGKFETWQPIQLPTGYLLLPENQLPSPPFPDDTAVPISGKFYWTDLKAESGLVATAWTPHHNEIYETSYKADATGIEIQSGDNTMLITDEEIIASKGRDEVFKITGDFTNFKYTNAEMGKTAGLTTQKVKIQNNEFVIQF